MWFECLNAWRVSSTLPAVRGLNRQEANNNALACPDRSGATPEGRKVVNGHEGNEGVFPTRQGGQIAIPQVLDGTGDAN